MDFSRSFAPFKHRQFTLFWVGAFVSTIGTWMESTTVGIIVTNQTGQARWTGLVAAAAFVPNALLGPFGGALADRLSRRRLLLATIAAQTGIAGLLTFLVAIDLASPWTIVGIVFTAGCVGALGFPTFQAMLPDLVPPDDLQPAVALSSAQWNLGRVIGPAIAAVVVAAGGYAWALGVNTLSFLALLGALLMMTIPQPVSTGEASIFKAIGAGWKFVATEPGIRLAMIYLALNAFFAAPFIGLVQAMAILVLDSGESGTGWLIAAQGAGAAIAVMLLGGFVVRFGQRKMLLGACAALPLTLVGYAASPNIVVATFAIFVVGGVYFTALSSCMTVAQMRSPANMRGRVMSVFMLVLGTLYPAGAVLQGWVGDHVGLRQTTSGAAAVLLAIFCLTALAQRQANHALEEAPVNRETLPDEHLGSERS